MVLPFVLTVCLFSVVVLAGYPGKENAKPVPLNMLTQQTVPAAPGFFSFVLSTASFVSISAKPLDNATSSGSFQLDLIDSNETFFGSAGTSAGAELSALLLAGTYIMYMPNVLPLFNLQVSTSVCGDDGVPAPTAGNTAISSALDVDAARADALTVWFCPPAPVPENLFFKIRSATPGSVQLSLSTNQNTAPIFGATLALLKPTGEMLSSCGGAVDFSSGPSCGALLSSASDAVIARISRPSAIAGGRLRLQLSFDACVPDAFEPNGLPPATPIAEGGSVLAASICKGDHDFFQLPLSAGAKVVGARIDGAPGDWVLRIIQRTGSNASYVDATLAMSEPAVGASKVGAWVLLPENAEQVFLEVKLNTPMSAAPFYNLSVAIGFPYEIDVTKFENEIPTTTAASNATATTDVNNNSTAATNPDNSTATLSPTTMTRKRQLSVGSTAFFASATATLADQCQKIFNDFGDIVPIVQGASASTLALLLPASNAAKLAAAETTFRAKLAEAKTIAKFNALGLQPGAARPVVVTAAPDPLTKTTVTAATSSSASRVAGFPSVLVGSALALFSL
jgi:hypothetical protein